MALGIGEATCLSPTISLLGDYFGKHDRGRAAGVLQAALQLGLAIGLIVGGFIVARFGWRAAFYLAALPGLLMAVLALTLRERPRGAAESSGATAVLPHETGRHAFTRLLSSRALVAGIVANTFVLFATTGVGGFIALYVKRQFGIGLAQVGAMVGIPLLIGSLAGNALGGWLVDWRSRHSGSAHLEIAALASVLGAVGLVVTFSVRSPAAFMVAFLVATLTGNLGMPALLAINQNLVIPLRRGSATAIQQFSSNLLGRAIGLSLIGLVSDQLHDLRLALLLLPPTALVVAAIAAASGWSSMAGDIAAMELEWERSAAA